MLDVFAKAESLSEIEFLAHGTTVVINALTERKGAKTGLITTQGLPRCHWRSPAATGRTSST